MSEMLQRCIMVQSVPPLGGKAPHRVAVKVEPLQYCSERPAWDFTSAIRVKLLPPFAKGLDMWHLKDKACFRHRHQILRRSPIQPSTDVNVVIYIQWFTYKELSFLVFTDASLLTQNEKSGFCRRRVPKATCLVHNNSNEKRQKNEIGEQNEDVEEYLPCIQNQHSKLLVIGILTGNFIITRIFSEQRRIGKLSNRHCSENIGSCEQQVGKLLASQARHSRWNRPLFHQSPACKQYIGCRLVQRWLCHGEWRWSRRQSP